MYAHFSLLKKADYFFLCFATASVDLWFEVEGLSCCFFSLTFLNELEEKYSRSL